MLGDSRIMKNLGEKLYMPDLAQHLCNRTVYSRSGATPLQQQDCLRVISLGRFQTWSNTAATGLCTGQFVSEQEANTVQIWSNTPTIRWLIRS